jgi:pimeloyl-ACP methyl ester carboxylesterase
VLAAGFFLTGCITERGLATRIVRAPNQHGVPGALKKAATFTDLYLPNWTVRVGPPAADLSVAIVEPNDYEFDYRFAEEPGAKSSESGKFAFHFSARMAAKDPAAEHAKAPPKGTLVLLHGIMMNKESILVPWGLFFAQKGYRVVIVDLRGHGRSTGDWIGYGAWEADDLVKVADELQRRGLIEGRIGVFGISYGAVMALHWAARDPRVAAVVALAPFSDPRRAIGEFARGVMPKLARGISETKFAAAEERAARMAGFTWAETDVLSSMRAVHAPVLFFHGRYDDWISPAHSAELMKVAPRGSRRMLGDDNHLTLTLRLDPIGERSLAWFDSRLTTTVPLVGGPE